MRPVAYCKIRKPARFNYPGQQSHYLVDPEKVEAGFFREERRFQAPLLVAAASKLWLALTAPVR
jgi:hypothetical protein